MSVHYNAFISYRHSPVDSRIAALVQRSLERFRVPGAIRKKTGRKKIDRLFRDKEELPITSDLNDDIAEALANSDYLIVICSPRTCESVWVQREIETFLKNHTRRQVLTVLAEGDPSETIPEILQYDVQRDPETGEERRIPIEPLSCDWRMSNRQAKREELPRLAAALLGCGYDELRQRQRQYKMRRITVGFTAALAASLALTAYFVHTSMTIQENYEQSLRSQSQYLASESLDCMESGDRMTAIQLALSALPGEGNERPIVPEAELALSEAVGAYVAEASEPVAVGAYLTEGSPTSVKAVPELERVFILDDQNLLTIWDLNTSRRIASIRPEGDAAGFRVTGDRLILWHGDEISGYDALTGEAVWRQSFRVSEVAITPDGSAAVAVGFDEEFRRVLCHIACDTGEITYRYLIENYVEGMTPTFYALPEDHISPDGTLIGFSVGGSYTDEELGYVTDRRIYVYDWQKGEGSYLDQSFYLISDFCFTADNDLILSGMREDDGNYGYGNSYAFYNAHTLIASGLDIMRVDLRSGAAEWQTRVDYYQVNYRTMLQLCPGNTELLCTVSNVCCRLDCATGEILGRGEATAAIIDARMEEGRDFAQLILMDGGMGNYNFTDDHCTCRAYFLDDLRYADLIRGVDGYNNIYVCPLYGNQVLRYSFGVRDENICLYEGVQSSTIDSAWITEDYLAAINYNDILSVYSLDEQKLLYSFTLAEEGSYSAYQMDCLGVTEDGQYLCFFCEGYSLPTVVRCFALASGTYIDYTLPLEEECSVNALPVVADGTIYCALERYGGGTVFAMRGLEEEEWTTYELTSVLAGVTAQLFVKDSGIILCDDTGVCRMIDLKKLEMAMTELALWRENSYLDAFQLIWDASGNYMAAVELERIVLCNGGGSVTGEILLNDRAVYGMTFHEDTLFVLGSDYYLYRYDLNGTFLSRSNVASYINASSSPDMDWHFLADGDLALVCDGVFSLISCDGWKVSAYATQAIGYDTVRDRLLVCTALDEGYGVGAYQRYSVENLVEMGKALVGASALSEETKSLYGIS